MHADGTADNDGAGQHPCAAKRARSAADDYEPSPHAVADAAAGAAADNDGTLAHAKTLARKGSAELIAGITGDAQLATPHSDRSTVTSRTRDPKGAAGHYFSGARADIALDDEFASRHAGADIVESIIAAGDHHAICRIADPLDTKPIAEHAAAIALNERATLERGDG